MNEEYIKEFVKDRDEAFIDAVLNDNWEGIKKHCKKYGITIPKEKTIMKAGIYKAVQECINISDEIKGKAAAKCLELGFNPFVKR